MHGGAFDSDGQPSHKEVVAGGDHDVVIGVQVAHLLLELTRGGFERVVNSESQERGDIGTTVAAHGRDPESFGGVGDSFRAGPWRRLRVPIPET